MEIREISSLQGIENALRKELEHIAEGYIVVGYLLKKTRDSELFKEKGFEDVYDFAKQTFNISRTWAIRFMQINDTYSIEGNSPEIQDRYKGYGSSKLSEMLALPENIREEVPATATVKEIREVKEVVRDTEDRYSPQMSLCDVAQNQEMQYQGEWGKQLVFEFFKTEKQCFEKMRNLQNASDRDVMAVVAPTKFRMFRMQKANTLFGESKIQIMPYNGQGENETLNYQQFLTEFREVFGEGTDSEVYEAIYHEPLKEKKEREVIKAEKLKPEQTKEKKHKENKDISDTGSAGVPEKDEEPEAETGPQESEEIVEKDHIADVGEMVEEEITGQMELTRDMPEYCPENATVGVDLSSGQDKTVYASEPMNEPGKQETEKQESEAGQQEPEDHYGSRKQYLDKLTTEEAAKYIADFARGVPRIRINFTDTWKEWLSAEVDETGEEIEVVE